MGMQYKCELRCDEASSGERERELQRKPRALPLPLGPRSMWRVPGGTRRVASSSAGADSTPWEAYCTRMFWAATA